MKKKNGGFDRFFGDSLCSLREGHVSCGRDTFPAGGCFGYMRGRVEACFGSTIESENASRQSLSSANEKKNEIWAFGSLIIILFLLGVVYFN